MIFGACHASYSKNILSFDPRSSSPDHRWVKVASRSLTSSCPALLHNLENGPNLQHKFKPTPSLGASHSAQTPEPKTGEWVRRALEHPHRREYQVAEVLKIPLHSAMSPRYDARSAVAASRSWLAGTWTRDRGSWNPWASWDLLGVWSDQARRG